MRFEVEFLKIINKIMYYVTIIIYWPFKGKYDRDTVRGRTPQYLQWL